MKDKDVMAMGLIAAGVSAVYSVLPDDVKKAMKELVKEVAKGVVEGLIEEVRK